VSGERNRSSPAVLAGATKLKDGFVQPQLGGDAAISNDRRNPFARRAVPGVTVGPERGIEVGDGCRSGAPMKAAKDNDQRAAAQQGSPPKRSSPPMAIVHGKRHAMVHG
jgi:hypothetical protein